MKIISKFKDYYDYLTGIYGIDEKLILDRTEYYTNPNIPTDYDIIRLCICDYWIEGIYFKGEYLFGKEIEKLIDKPKKKYWTLWRSEEEYYYLQDKYRTRVLKQPKLLKNSPNTILNCPILLCTNYDDRNYNNKNNEYSKFPILKDYNIVKVYSPEAIWLMLSEWLGREKIIPNKQTDKEKIISKGFDIKTSFRKM